jgi:rhodanese-related sulfurtransferase
MMRKDLALGSALAMAAMLATTARAESLAVGITPELQKFEGTINGQPITIVRNQDQSAVVNPAFAKTSRKCPPFCIQPQSLGQGVETIAEVELIGYLQKMAAGDTSILLVDSRTPDWVARGTIPGAINLPWTKLNPAKGASPIDIADILTGQFGARDLEGLWDFSEAKTLILFCNGMWCGQSPNNIKNLLRFGYPADKIKWYRGGMQDWEMLGLSTAKP